MKEEVRDRNRKIREEVSNEPREIYYALIQGRNAIERDKKRAKEKSKKIQGRRNKQDEGRIGWDKEKDTYKNKQKERMKRKKKCSRWLRLWLVSHIQQFTKIFEHFLIEKLIQKFLFS